MRGNFELKLQNSPEFPRIHAYLIPGSLYAFSNLARDSTNCVLFTDKVCMTRRNRSIMHSRLVRSKKQLRRDVFMTILIDVQHEP